VKRPQCRACAARPAGGISTKSPKCLCAFSRYCSSRRFPRAAHKQVPGRQLARCPRRVAPLFGPLGPASSLLHPLAGHLPARCRKVPISDIADYSITPSARASSKGGTARPSAGDAAKRPASGMSGARGSPATSGLAAPAPRHTAWVVSPVMVQLGGSEAAREARPPIAL
jgi:hypothetical protein